MIKMCVFDVDGTLYDYYNHKILDSTVYTINQLKEKGIKVVVATGRCHYALGKELNDLKMDYVIAVNGSVIVNNSNEILNRRDFSLREVQELLDFAHSQEAGFCFKFIDHTYIYQYPDKIDWYEGQINSDIGKKPFVDCFNQDRHLVDLPQSACIHAPLKEIEKQFQHHPTIEFIQYSEDGFDVVPKGMNKGIGIQELMKITGFNRDEIMVFGDNYNDLPMFEMADTKVAMGNAIDEVKQKATYISEDCAHDGIYHACKYYNLID